MRWLGLLVGLSAIATGCGHARNPRMVATAGTQSAGYALVSREAEDDLTFKVPPQSLARCLQAAQQRDPEADGDPQLSEPFSIRALRAGCDNERRMQGRATTALTSVRLRLLIGADGMAKKVEVDPATTLADRPLQECLVASAHRNQFPKNFNKQPYEEVVDVVYFYSFVGETRWKMLDTVRRLDEPTRETCQCMLDHPIERASTFEVRFTLPESETEATPQGLKVVGKGTSSPLAACYGQAIAARTFYGRGASTDITYEFKVLPTPRIP